MRLRSGQILNAREGEDINCLAKKLAKQELRETEFNIGPLRDLPLQPFNGTTSITHFIERFELVANVKRWDDAEKLRWFPLCLTAVPLHFFDSLLDDVKNDYEQLKNAFLEEYNSPVQKSHNMSRLANIKQISDETVVEFYTRLINIAHSTSLVWQQIQKKHFV